MNVKQLIEELQKLDPEIMVIVDGYEGGYDEVLTISIKPIQLNKYVDSSYFGNHGEPWLDEEKDCDAVHIGV